MADVDAIAVAGAIYGAINIVAAFVHAVAHNGLGHGFCSDQAVPHSSFTENFTSVMQPACSSRLHASVV